jgi:cell wall integrity and stress response component
MIIPVTEQFMSNGACQTHCQGAFAFAVIQGSSCWCSNYIPALQQSTYNCNDPCPGFPSEWCGSTDTDLFAYFLLAAGVPLGTSGSGSSGPSSTQASSPSPSPSPSPVSIAASTPLSFPTPASTSNPDTGSPREPLPSTNWPNFRSTFTMVTFGSSQSTAESITSTTLSSIDTSSSTSSTVCSAASLFPSFASSYSLVLPYSAKLVDVADDSTTELNTTTSESHADPIALRHYSIWLSPNGHLHTDTNSVC